MGIRNFRKIIYTIITGFRDNESLGIRTFNGENGEKKTTKMDINLLYYIISTRVSIAVWGPFSVTKMDKTGITVFVRFISLLCSLPIYEIKTNDGNNHFFELDNHKTLGWIKMFTNTEFFV